MLNTAGYSLFILAALDSPGFKEYWNQVGFAFSEDFKEWMNTIISGSEVHS